MKSTTLLAQGYLECGLQCPFWALIAAAVSKELSLNVRDFLPIAGTKRQSLRPIGKSTNLPQFNTSVSHKGTARHFDDSETFSAIQHGRSPANSSTF
jgi:hypothetical protein